MPTAYCGNSDVQVSFHCRRHPFDCDDSICDVCSLLRAHRPLVKVYDAQVILGLPNATGVDGGRLFVGQSDGLEIINYKPFYLLIILSQN